MFELCLAYTKVLTEKWSYKGSPVDPGGLHGLEMIFALLTEVIAVHMQLTIIYF